MRYWWMFVNVVVLPPAGMAALLILVFTYWIGSPAAFNLRSSLAMLPWVLLLGAGLGLVLGLLQALALRGRVGQPPQRGQD
jgi:NhaP-type Na+/H+ or K+/H+ antiporter